MRRSAETEDGTHAKLKKFSLHTDDVAIVKATKNL